MAFIMKQRSSKENFTIIPPEVSNARGSETGTVLVDGSHSAGDTTIVMNGFANNTAGVFKAGDFIKFANQTKVYMIISAIKSAVILWVILYFFIKVLLQHQFQIDIKHLHLLLHLLLQTLEYYLSYKL